MKTIKRVLLAALVFLLMGSTTLSHAEDSYPYLEVTKLPDKVVYFLAESLDTTGIELKLRETAYSAVVYGASDPDLSFSPTTLLATGGVGRREVTARVRYEGKSYSAKFTVFLVNAGRTLQDTAGYPSYTNYGYDLTKEKSLKTYTCSGAKSLLLQFSEATATDCCDYIYIEDGNGDLIGIYEERELSGKKLWITGDSFSIWITSDEDDCCSDLDYGYRFDAIWSVNVDTCPHLYTDPVVTPATCTKDGSSVIECVSCGDTQVTVLPKLSEDGKHTYDYDQRPEDIYHPSTAYIEGYYDLYYACLVCGYKNVASGYSSSYIKPDYGDCGQNSKWALLNDGTMVIFRRAENMSHYDLYCAPGKADEVKALYVQDQTGTIYPESFKNCTSLTSVRLPSSLRKIGADAFWGCYALTEISFSGSLAEIGNNAFRLSGLTSVDFGDTSPVVGDYAFAYCDSLSTVNFGTGAVTVGYSAFDECPSIMQLDIPASVTLGRYAFHKCTGLTTVTARCKDIPDSCFESCWALSSVTLENTETIGEYAFGGTEKLRSIVFPATLTKIEMAFTEQAGRRPALASATFHSKATVIDDYTFKSVGKAQLTIYGPACSTAAAFAGKMGYTFSATDQSSHTPEVVPAVEATCLTAGYTEGQKCSACGYAISAPVSLGVNSHAITEWTSVSDSQHSRRCLTCDTKTETASHERVLGFCSVCGRDDLFCSLSEGVLELELMLGEPQTATVVIAVYDAEGKMISSRVGTWETDTLYNIAIPEAEQGNEVKVFFLCDWSPLRPALNSFRTLIHE